MRGSDGSFVKAYRVHTVTGGIFLPSHKSLRVEETPVRAVSDFINDIRFQVNVKGPGHVFAGRGFGEKRAEAAIVSGGRAFQQATIRL
jgi:hypothetical protein